MRLTHLAAILATALLVGACANSPFYVSGVTNTFSRGGDETSDTVGVTIAPNPRYLPPTRGLRK